MEEKRVDIEQKFDLEAIEKTFTSYKKGQMFDGVVLIKRQDGAIFNIGGKNDAFLPKEEEMIFSLAARLIICSVEQVHKPSSMQI